MQQQRIPNELVPDEEVVVGDPILDTDGPPEFVKNEEWDRLEKYSVEWGTYRFRAITAVDTNPDGANHNYTGVLPASAPSEAPPAAEVILRDLADRGVPDCYVAVSLAQQWGIDLDELEVGDRVREEVLA